MIITATLITVAAIDNLMMNLEKDFCWLNAILRAIKLDRFTIKSYGAGVKSNFSGIYFVCQGN
jgi:hypothetical protein